jgi:hypothetical protein
LSLGGKTTSFNQKHATEQNRITSLEKHFTKEPLFKISEIVFANGHEPQTMLSQDFGHSFMMIVKKRNDAWQDK